MDRPDQAKKLAIQMAASLKMQRERLIREAINHAIGDDWALEDLKGRGCFYKYPDGKEVFVFDDKPMIEFHGFKPELNHDPLNPTAGIKVFYKKLY